PDGAVKAVRTARDDAATPDIACCVRRELQQLRFPAPGRPIALEHVASYDPRSLQERYAGSLGKEDLRAVVQAHDAELRPCFDASVQQGLTHGGRVAVSFVIGPAGDVTRASVVEDTVGSPSAACCAVAKVRGWQFPKPNKGGPVHVTYPFDVQLGQP
ncbi:MAG TPA: TonB family protein, partial [Polyangiales bacterium]|nr:TonB family protein [Polyangiales bacterium]